MNFQRNYKIIKTKQFKQRMFSDLKEQFSIPLIQKNLLNKCCADFDASSNR